MNLQPVFEAAEQTERGQEKRRGWSIEELRERLGVAAPVEKAEQGKKKSDQQDEPERRAAPRIVKRGMAPALA